MARKHQNTMEESSSEEEETTIPELSSSPPKEPQHHSSSSNSDESESYESDSDEAEPSGTKPIEETPKTTVAISNPKHETEFAKKKLFERLWSEEDEIALLSGMIEFCDKKGLDRISDMNAFLEFIKDSLHVHVTKGQLSDKIFRLKKKYHNILKRERKAKDPTFSKSHDQKSFDLSKKIWGNGKATLPTPTNKREIDRCVGETVVVENNMEDYVLEHGLKIVDSAKRVKLENKWRNLHIAQLELFVQRCGLILEQSKLILESFTSSNN